MNFQITDWYAGIGEDYVLKIEGEITERGWRGDRWEPGYGPDFEVTGVYLNDAPVYGAQKEYLINSRYHHLVDAANECDEK